MIEISTPLAIFSISAQDVALRREASYFSERRTSQGIFRLEFNTFARIDDDVNTLNCLSFHQFEDEADDEGKTAVYLYSYALSDELLDDLIKFKNLNKYNRYCIRFKDDLKKHILKNFFYCDKQKIRVFSHDELNL